LPLTHVLLAVAILLVLQVIVASADVQCAYAFQHKTTSLVTAWLLHFSKRTAALGEKFSEFSIRSGVTSYEALGHVPLLNSAS